LQYARRGDGGGRTYTLSRRYNPLKPYRAPHIVVYLLSFDLYVAPKLVAISAVIAIDVPNPEDSDTEN
jgi:hypothetical protein